MISSFYNLTIVQELLNINMQQNLQLVVQVAKEYTEQLGANKIIELLETHRSYHGLYYYLGSSIAFSEDPEVKLTHFLGLIRCISCQVSQQWSLLSRDSLSLFQGPSVNLAWY